jgi:hypothetical protein
MVPVSSLVADIVCRFKIKILHNLMKNIRCHGNLAAIIYLALSVIL